MLGECSTWSILAVLLCLIHESGGSSHTKISGYKGPLQEGDDLKLTCSRSSNDGSAQPKVVWGFTAVGARYPQILSGSRNYFKPSVTVTDAGNYTCYATGSSGELDKTTIKVQVLPSDYDLTGEGSPKLYQDIAQGHSAAMSGSESFKEQLMHLNPLYVGLMVAIAVLLLTIVLSIFVVRRVKRKLRIDQEINKLLADLNIK